MNEKISGDYRKLLELLIGLNRFSPEHDAKALRRAMRGLGTNNDMIIQIFGSRTVAQRLQISLGFFYFLSCLSFLFFAQFIKNIAYQTMYKRDLLKDFISETSGNFRNLLKCMLMSLAELDAWAVNQAVKVEFFYFILFFYFIFIFLTSNFQPFYYHSFSIFQFFNFSSFFQGLGTDDDTLIEVLCSRNNRQIKEMKEAYQKCNFFEKIKIK